LANIFKFENKAMKVIIFVTSIFLVLVLNVPLLMELFHFAPLSLSESGIGVLIGALSIAGIMPLRKIFGKTVKTK